MRFNHVACRVDAACFEIIVGMFCARLGFVELRRTERSVWLRQPGTNVDLQLSQSTTVHRDTDKRRSQISFLSDTPEADLQGLARWALACGMEGSVGAYSEREFFFDIPGAFVDFVIEAMLPELAMYEIDP